jgi:hypothetical protein
MKCAENLICEEKVETPFLEAFEELGRDIQPPKFSKFGELI